MSCKTLSVMTTLFVAVSFLGCSAVASSPSRSLYKVSRRAKYEPRKVTLTTTQQEKISHILGNQIPVEEVVRYYKARTWKGMGVKGEIFVINGESTYGAYRILALVKQNNISVLVQDKAVFKDGTPVISQEFLTQFVGKSLNQSFAIASAVEDVLQVPQKVRPIANEVKLSKEIALRVKKALAEAVVIKSQI